jgi:hypothetical protein
MPEAGPTFWGKGTEGSTGLDPLDLSQISNRLGALANVLYFTRVA